MYAFLKILNTEKQEQKLAHNKILIVRLLVRNVKVSVELLEKHLEKK